MIPAAFAVGEVLKLGRYDDHEMLLMENEALMRLDADGADNGN